MMELQKILQQILGGLKCMDARLARIERAVTGAAVYIGAPSTFVTPAPDVTAGAGTVPDSVYVLPTPPGTATVPGAVMIPINGKVS